MRGALVRLGVEPGAAAAVLEGCGVEPRMRPEELSLDAFACLADALLASGARLPDARGPSPRKRARA